MKKTTLLATTLLAMTTTAALAQTAPFETAAQAVTNMGLGWNLGNTLDANSQQVADINNPAYWGQQDLTSENCWGQYTTRPELLAMLKDAGFGAIRVPVTWYNHMDKDGNVDAAWMKRVHQVVDYVVGQGLYCLLNVHHDTGADSYDDQGRLTGYHWLKADEQNYAQNRSRYEHLWTQIATEFRDYDQHLLFESYNEMLDAYSSWCYASMSAPGGYSAQAATTAYNGLNSYAQSFVSTVRATGGNNATRNLVVNTYGACDGRGNWSTHLQEPITRMQVPADPAAPGHIIIQLHCYPGLKAGNLSSVKAEVQSMMAYLKNTSQQKGVPFIIGEWGTIDWDSDVNYADNRQNFLSFCQYFVEQAKACGIGTFYWMGISDGASRLFPAFSQADLAKTLLQAYHGTSYQPVLPVRSDYTNTCITATVNYTNQWGEFNLFTGQTSASDYSGIALELASAPAAGLLQYKVYATAEKYQPITTAQSTLSFTAAMGTISRITLQCLKSSGTVTVKNVWLLKKDGTRVPSDPSVFWGCTMTDVVLSGLVPVVSDATPQADRRMYNLQGQRISQPIKGLYIMGGRKYLVK